MSAIYSDSDSSCKVASVSSISNGPTRVHAQKVRLCNRTDKKPLTTRRGTAPPAAIDGVQAASSQYRHCTQSMPRRVFKRPLYLNGWRGSTYRCSVPIRSYDLAVLHDHGTHVPVVNARPMRRCKCWRLLS